MLPPGYILQQRYIIDKVLGEGGMGAVYLARLARIGGKKVAIKEMIVDLHDPNARNRAIAQFHKEAQILSSLDHLGLVKVLGFFVEGGAEYLVMEYVDGQTLDALFHKQRQFLEIDLVMRWIDQLCDVLSYLHAHDPPVIFRDLKPSNIMLDSAGRIRLIDFGIARSVEVDSKTTTFIKGAGTHGFAPVEQYGGGTTDERSDIYSLGATMYVLLTRCLPPASIAIMSGEESLWHTTQFNPAVPHALDSVIMKCLSIRKEDRFQSVDAVRMALENAMIASAAMTITSRFCISCGAGVGMDESLCRSCGRAASAKGPPPPELQPHGHAAVDHSQAPTMLPPVGGTPGSFAAAAPRAGSDSFARGSAASDSFARAARPESLDKAPPTNVPSEAHAHRPRVASTGGSKPVFPPPPASTRSSGSFAKAQPPANSGGAPMTPPTLPKGPPSIAAAHVEEPHYSTIASGPRVRPPRLKADEPRRHVAFMTFAVPIIVLAVVVGFLLAYYLHSASAPISVVPSLSTLQVDSTPSGASVMVDGTQKGVTPLTLAGIPNGMHQVEVQLTGYESKQVKVELPTYGNAPVEVALEQSRPDVTVTADPPGPVDVRSDGVYLGEQKSPLHLSLTVGSHQLNFSRTGFKAVDMTLQIDSSKPVALKIKLNPMSTLLQISSTPSGATVFVDGNKVGLTPFRSETVAPGPHWIRVSLAGYKTYAEQAQIDTEPHIITTDLKPEAGHR